VTARSFPADPLGFLASLSCLGTHLLAGMATLVVLLPGTPLDADLHRRARYLCAHRIEWGLGWSTWALAVLALYAFYWTLGRRLAVGGLSWIPPLVSLLTLAGLAVDVSGQVIYTTMTPGLARRLLDAGGGDRAVATGWFLWSERIATLLSGGIANGLYTLAGTVLCVAARADPRFPAWLRAAALPVWIAGLAISIASVSGAPGWIAVTTAGGMGLFVVWCSLVALFYFGKVPPLAAPEGDRRPPAGPSGPLPEPGADS
jgi:hypothetical protein